MFTWGCCRYHQWDNFQDSGFQQTLGKKAQAMQFSLDTERSIMVIKHQKSDSDRFYLCNSPLDHRNYGCGCRSCLRQIRVGGDKPRLGRSKHKCQVQPQVKKNVLPLRPPDPVDATRLTRRAHRFLSPGPITQTSEISLTSCGQRGNSPALITLQCFWLRTILNV